MSEEKQVEEFTASGDEEELIPLVDVAASSNPAPPPPPGWTVEDYARFVAKYNTFASTENAATLADVRKKSKTRSEKGSRVDRLVVILVLVAKTLPLIIGIVIAVRLLNARADRIPGCKWVHPEAEEYGYYQCGR
ncbi:uncharacterized protein V1518DRAFT_425978 [Limtongia smithiae]|uniref:uncharacterized protein n=1 Tax=Limtongia smithiae TaxID=1125753 RepID=UPI0034CE8772